MEVIVRGQRYLLEELSLIELIAAYKASQNEHERRAIAQELADRAIREDEHEK